jgi:hypothetical protein
MRGRQCGPGEHGDVEPSLRDAGDRRDQLRLRQGGDAATVEHLGGVAAERAVSEQLDPLDAQPVVAVAGTDASGDEVVEAAGMEEDAGAQRQLTGVAQGAQQVEVGRRLDGMDARHAHADELTQRRGQGRAHRGGIRLGDADAHHLRRVLAHDPARLAVHVAIDDPAGRIGGVPVDPRHRQRRRAGPRQVGVAAVDEHRAATARLVELRGRQGVAGRPRGVVDVMADDPGAGWEPIGVRAHPALHVGGAGRAREVERQAIPRHPAEVDVAVGEAGAGATIQLHDPGLRAEPDGGVTDGEDATTGVGRDGGLAAGEEHCPLRHPVDRISLAGASMPCSRRCYSPDPRRRARGAAAVKG